MSFSYIPPKSASLTLEQGSHASDFCRLVSLDGQKKLGQFRILSGAGVLQQCVNHVQSTLVVMNHAGQEQVVEICPSCSRQLGHLSRGQHAGHQRCFRGLTAVHGTVM